MALTSLKDSFFLKCLEIASVVKWEPAKVGGHVSWLYHDSQEQERLSGSRKEFRRWAKISETDLETLLPVMIEHELVEQKGDDEFFIVGNKKHIKNLREYKKKKQEAGKRRSNSAERDEKGHFKKRPARRQHDTSTTPAESQHDSSTDPAILHTLHNTSLHTSHDITNTTIHTLQASTPLAERWLQFAFEKTPGGKFKLESFESAIEDVCTQAHLTIPELEALFDFIQADDFWRPNAISPVGLLKISKSNGLRKIDNIKNAFLKSPSAKMSAILAWAQDPSSSESCDPFAVDGGFANDAG